MRTSGKCLYLKQMTRKSTYHKRFTSIDGQFITSLWSGKYDTGNACMTVDITLNAAYMLVIFHYRQTSDVLSAIAEVLS
jgi:hypothetical protein